MTMRVKQLTLEAGPNGIVKPGTIREVSDAEGKQLIDGRYAELYDPKKEAAKKAEAKAKGKGKEDED